jgi:major membrane immunogen (membrane-anchored lipoprotein)
MVEFGNATSYWYEQADSTIDYFLENQSVEVPEDFYTSEEGHTDAIAGVTIHVVEFFDLAEKALANGPVPEGDYTDGYPMAAGEPSDNGWQSMIQLTVVNGTIVSANVNAVSTEENAEGEFDDKKALKEDYGMKAAGSDLEWYEQAALVEEYIVENQNLDIPLEDGYTDAIAGVSIHVDEMVELFNEAVGGTSSTGELEDGVYYAEQDEFGGSGWKYHVILTVEDGKFVDAQWKGTHRVPQTNKYDQSVNGEYGMVEFGNATSYWYEQADSTIDYFLENQSVEVPEDFYTSEEGHTDAIAGVTIHVVEFFDLAEKALANGPVPEGDYTDGYPMAAGEPSDNGWQSMIQLTVVNGTIVSANVNAVSTEENAEGEFDDKKALKEDYGMKAAGSDLEWYEQAALVEEYIVENQNLDIPLEDGYTDAIAGVSIHVDEMVELFNEAVK